MLFEVTCCTECAYNPSYEDPYYYDRIGVFSCPFCCIGIIKVEIKK
jgi:hypothetical protein